MKNLTAFEDMLPEGATFMSGVRVVQYFDEHGETKWAARYAGESSVSTALGLLELVKADILRRNSQT